LSGVGLAERVSGFDEFYAGDFPRLVAFLCKRGFECEVAKDAAADAMATAFEQWGSITYPTAWVRRVGFRNAATLVSRARESAEDRLNDLLEDPAVEVPAAVGGDRHAIARLLASLSPLVVRYCRARVGRQERSFASADDVAQEVCLAVLTALPSYRDQGRPFLAFVYGIAQHKVADAHRAAARNRAEPVAEIPEEAGVEVGPEARALQGELNERMSVLLRVLPDKQREIVVLRVVVGLSAEETAEAVGSTPGAVRVAQHRALARLRKVLAAEEVI
jgi:RNA polymerase sigma-70 factor (ECF subfamily)